MKFVVNKDIILENYESPKPVQQLDEIEEIASTLDDNLNKEVDIPKDVLDSFRIKDTLNTKLWDEKKLKPEVREKLLDIANQFIIDINLPKGIVIKDIIFTGSLANYNWSKFSDIDLHVVLDYGQFDASPEIVENYLKLQKTLWNLEHDITIYDYPVELYIQDSNQELHATAVYSVLKDKWNKKPIREKFAIDKKTIKAKAEKFINQLKDIKSDYKEKEYQLVIDKVTKIKNKIKKMRMSGLEDGGELSQENIVFKVLRRTPFLDVLDSYKAKAYDSLMSLNEMVTEEKENWVKDGVVFILGPKLEDGTKRLFATNIKNMSVLDKKKMDDTDANSANVVLFGNNEVYRVGVRDGQMKALKVGWNSTESMLQKLGLSKTSVVLNKDKTPFHWDTLNITSVPQAINTFKNQLQNLPNIRWEN